MEAYPSSNKQTNIWKKKEKTKNPSNHNVKQKNDENQIGKNPKMSWIWWLKKIFSYLALKWCPYTQIQFICLALLMNWQIGENH